MVWAGRQVYDGVLGTACKVGQATVDTANAIKNKTCALANSLQQSTKDKFAQVMTAKMAEFEKAMAGKRKALCAANIGSQFYGNMATWCDKLDFTTCNGGVAEMYTYGTCGPKFDEIYVWMDKPRCSPPMTGTVGLPKQTYTESCVHQVDGNTFTVSWICMRPIYKCHSYVATC